MTPVLHITSWYPGINNPVEGLFIKKHIQSVNQYFENYILHINISRSKRAKVQYDFEGKLNTIIVMLPIPWKLIEWISGLLIVFIWVVYYRWKNIQLINFHIYYPNAATIRILKKILRRKVLITEHWSAFHYNFHLPDHKLPKLRNTIDTTIPWISVSRSLRNDITRFIGNGNLNISIVPNVVDTRVFTYQNTPRKNYFIAVSNWKRPKRPEIILSAFNNILKQNPLVELKLAGKGELIPDIRRQANELGILDALEFIGWVSPGELSALINGSIALIHCSDYETFSVVCAESLCCGTPVIASSVGGITEYLERDYGFLVKRNDTKLFAEKMMLMINESDSFDRHRISKEAISKFNAETIGKMYAGIIQRNL